jgi:hypothetical protein
MDEKKSRGGSRPNAGRKAKVKLPTASNKTAEIVLGMLGHEYKGGRLPKEVDLWLDLIAGDKDKPDKRLRFDVLKYLNDVKHGKAVQTINHLHDKPIELHHTFSLSDRIKRARERVASVKA